MNNERPKDIPYIAFEGEMARMERIIKRLWVVLIVTIILLVGSNAAWLYYEAQFTDEEWSVTQDVVQTTDRGGINSFVGGNYNGNAESNNDSN